MKKQKLYGLFRWNADGELEGFVENSFSMSWRTDRVAVLDKKAVNYYYEHGFPEPGMFVLRVSGPVIRPKDGVPFKVDIATLMKARTQHRLPEDQRDRKLGKFDRRNARFAPVEVCA